MNTKLRARFKLHYLYKTVLCGVFVFLYTALSAVPQYTPGQLLFKTSAPAQLSEGKTGLSAFDSYLSGHGVKGIKPIKGMPSQQYFQVDLSTMPDIAEMKSQSFAGIEYIEPNYLRKLHSVPNDPLFPRQLLHLSSIDQAWDYTTGNRQIIVAVIDSGLLIDHPDIAANVYINTGEIPDNGIDDDGNGYIDDWCGWDFVDAPEMAAVALGDYLEQDNDVTDENFHGTHVSGIIGAEGNNEIGISGVAWNVRIMPLRAGFRTVDAGYLQDDDAAAAIIYAADNGAHVINMSWGDPNYSAIIADACDYAYDKGVVLVASSGNDGSRGISYPAKLSNVISVGSVNHAKVLSNFSSFGPELDLVAPGEAILSTYKDSGADMYMEMSGTSMSAPMVSGSIALLLSLVPGLSPAEVRARLLSSTDDINSPGYDQFTGHGLLNTRKLLENLDPPFVKIDYPLDQSGITASTDIHGSVYGADFARYTLMYIPLPIQGSIQWMDASEHTAQPRYYTAEVHNGILGEFRIPSSFPDGTYLLRLQYEKRQNNLMKYNYYRTVTLNRSAPQIKPGSLHSFSRYDRAINRHYIHAAFDQKVNSQLEILLPSGDSRVVYGAVNDSLQIWALPPDLPPGSIDIRIKAVSHGNLSFESPLYPDFMEIAYEAVPTYGLSMQPIGTARVPLNKWHDFNGSGTAEYLAMDIPVAGYGMVRSYEPHPGGHVVTHQFDQNFWPLDIGTTNDEGMELLAIQSEIGKLWETKTGEFYPSPDSLIFNDVGITGGILADYNGNGRTDILLVKNEPAARVVQIYSRNNQGIMVPQAKLINSTQTSLRNNFVPTIIVEDFTENGQKEILTADTDGDVMIFHAQSNSSEMIWNHRLPVANAYQLAKGDFNGDLKQDFIVGGYNTDIVNPDLNFWHFEAFTATNDTTFSSLGSIQFNNVESQSGITVIDIDGDGQEEIVLGISPSLYIIKYIEGKLKPIFMGDSYANYRLAAWHDANDSPWIMSNYRVSPDSLIAVKWGIDASYTGAPIPVNFLAQAVDDHSVQLSWLGDSGSHFRLYRKDAADDIVMIDNILGNTFLDTGLETGQRYEYALSAVDPAFNPSESMLSPWQEAIPLPIPEILELFMVGSHELRALFNQQLDASALNPTLYSLSHNLKQPLSVNSTAQQHGVQIRFRDAFPQIDSLFTLSVHGLRGTSGIEIVHNEYHFPYIADMDPPRIVDVLLTDNNKAVKIIFSEDLEPLSATHLGNYSLHGPDNDPDNSIATVSADQNIVTLSFAKALKHSNNAYFVRVENVADLFGNRISPLHNLARFAVRDFSDLKDLVVFPNPFRHTLNSEILFMNFPTQKKGRIAIYDAVGSLVFKADIGPFNPENNNIIWRWDATNSSGKRISSGIYFYVIEMDNQRARGKFAVIN